MFGNPFFYFTFCYLYFPMTKLSKITSFISLILIVLSLVSLVILYKSSEPEIQVKDNQIGYSVRVAVLNGCGREGLASLFAEKLRTAGFDVVNGQGDNADSYDFENSIVVDRKGNKTYAKMVANALGIKEIIDQYSANPYIIEDVVVVLGRDWDTLTKQ